jgi:hypothetical protein
MEGITRSESSRTRLGPAAGPRSFDLLLGTLLGGIAFILYASTLAPTVLAGDGGEFQFVPYLLGVAHPTGYPLYCLLGWAWSHLLPVGDVAYRMNLFSALWAAMAVALLYPTGRTLLRQVLPALSPMNQRLIAALVCLTFAVTPTLWSQAVIAEVYSLHIFFVVLIFYLLLRWGEYRRAGSPPLSGDARGRRILLLVAACFGLSLTHHSTTVLLAPAILVYLWLKDPRVFRDWRRLWVPGLLLAILPLALYLYIPLRAPHTPYLSWPLDGDRELVLYDNTLAGLADFVTGGPFGGSVDLSVDFGARLAMAWDLLRGEVGWAGVVLALIGMAQLLFGRPPAGSRRGQWAFLALTGLTYLTTVAFNLVYTIGDIFVLFIPSYLVVMLWLALGVATLFQLLPRVWVRFANRERYQELGALQSRQPLPAVAEAALSLLLLVLPVWIAITHYDTIDQSQNTIARDRWEAILAEPLPPEAILISNDRNNMMPMWYFQFVERAPSGLPPGLMGIYPQITPDHPTVGHVLDLALSTGRPLYLVKEMPGIEVKVQAEAQGRLWRITGPAVVAEPAYPRDLRFGEAMSLTGYDRTPSSPRPGETLQVSLYWEALQPLDAKVHTFVHLLDPGGHRIAQSDRQPGGVYYPTTLWRSGERLRDDHSLAVPASAPVGVYRLLVGMYTLVDAGAAGSQLQPLGDPAIVGQVGVKTSVQTTPGSIDQPVEAGFASQIELLGYDLVAGKDELSVILHWQCLHRLDANYTVFVHLVENSGNVVVQHDGQPQSGAYPTSVWDVGEVVVDEHLLSLVPDLPGGDYGLRVGLYMLETGERLAVDGGGDSVELGAVELGN